MFKITLLLVCLAGIAIGAPRISSDTTSNAIFQPKTEKSKHNLMHDLKSSSEITDLFATPSEFHFDNLPMVIAVAFNEIAKQEGLTLDEVMFVVRLGIEAKKSKQEGKSSGEVINKENMCAEIKKLPPSSNKPADGKLSEMATTIPRMRQMCSIFDIIDSIKSIKPSSE